MPSEIFTGTAQLTPGSIAPASLQLVTKADSLTVIDKVGSGGRKKIETTMREQVLETGEHPGISFKRTKLDEAADH